MALKLFSLWINLSDQEKVGQLLFWYMISKCSIINFQGIPTEYIDDFIYCPLGDLNDFFY